MSAASRATTTTCTTGDPEKNAAPPRGCGALRRSQTTLAETNLAPRVNGLTRSKLVFRAYLDARALGDDDEAAELFSLWLRLLGKEREP